MGHVECGILGSGFYPGARGFDDDRSPYGGIMLLGRDFGPRTYYERLCGVPMRDETASTWRRTRDIYLASFAGLPVWCANYLMGVRNEGSSVGNVKARISLSDWVVFEGFCWRFLQAQVLLQKPRLLVVLGGDNRGDLTVNGRFGHVSGTHLRHTFKTEDGQHCVLVTFVDHPHSLIPKARQEDARRAAKRLKQIYEGEIREFGRPETQSGPLDLEHASTAKGTAAVFTFS